MLKKLLLIFFCISLLAHAAEFKPDRLVTYKTVDNIELKLHVFEPEDLKSSDKRAAIVFFFGGGWNGGSPKQFYEQARHLADLGMVALSADYRVKSRHKTTPFECVKDGKSAIRWVREHADELGVDPDRIVASGGSAGGHVAACTGIIKGCEEVGEDMSVSSLPNAMILFNPVLDTTDKGLGASRFKPDQQTDLSPCHQVKAGIAPSLVFHGTADTTVPFENAERFTRLMNEAGNQCDLAACEGRGHGFFNGTFFRPKNDGTDYKLTMERSVEFLTKLGYIVPLKNTVRPNVVLIMTDDQGYADLSCHGNPILKTPNMDRLHGESVRFTNFHVSPFCTPTRGALMTGRDPGHNGAYRTSSGRTMLHTDEKTIANLFADNGYATGMVGKWHLGDNAPHRPQDRGFQDIVWHRCGGIGQASDYWGNDYFDDTYERNGKFEKFEGYCTDVWFAEGMRFIEENRRKPFFLYLALNAPHGPYRVDPEWSAPYKDKVNWGQGANFYGMIANIDHNLGLLRQRLASLELAENTILIFMTDNGTSNGAKFKGLTSEAVEGFNAGMRGKKSSIYEGGHRVPFFIYWPGGGFEHGRDVSTLAAHIDVLPTLAELCQVSVPASYKPDGRSLAPLLKASNAPWDRDYIVMQYHGGAYFSHVPEAETDSYVMTQRWRLLNGNELYDILADPAQRTNVATEHPEVVARLQAFYKPYWESVYPRLTPVRIDIGNPAENPTILCSQDWYMPKGNPPWNFGGINKLPPVTGPWMIDVKKAGRYRLTLRQFPAEANKPVVAVSAKVQIAGLEKECLVEPDSKGVVFEIDLPAGPTELLTTFYYENGKAGGAYFTEVQAL